MATKRKRGDSWHYTIRRRGLLPRPVYLSFAVEAEGDAYVRQLERLLDQGIVPPEFLRQDKPTSVGDLVRGYLEAYAVSTSDRLILEAWGDLDRHRTQVVGFPWVEALVAGMKTARLAPGTIRHRVGALARCLDWAARRGEIQANPLRLLPRGYASYADGSVEDASRDRRLQPGEEAAIRRVLAGGYRPAGKQRPLALEHREAMLLLFELALETAMRLSEMFTLEWSQVDIDRRTVFLDRTKNGDRRQVPLSSVALAALSGCKKSDGPVMPFFDGDRRRTTARLSQVWSRVFQHAGCPDLRFHDLRHEATSRLFERTTLDAIEISRITGHRDPKMLRRYANLRGSTLAARLW